MYGFTFAWTLDQQKYFFCFATTSIRSFINDMHVGVDGVWTVVYLASEFDDSAFKKKF